jgi:FMN reductase
MKHPLIVGIGGTPNPNSSTEQALELALRAAEQANARTRMINGRYLMKLPLYLAEGSPGAGRDLIEAVREADGLIIASPGYHGSISGAVKNAIDYLEETAKDTRPYVDGLPVGLIVTAFGWQATGSTLATMRSIVHALRGWPTPLGAAINTSRSIFCEGVCSDANAAKQLALVGRQVAGFAALALQDPAIGETA